MDGQRKVIHVDLDAYYASVEQRDNPHYRGKPLVVGGSPDKRGAVAAASYEARKYGIHSAMPSRTALQRCPHLIFVSPRFEVYRAISEQIRVIFYRYTDWVEPLALDEAYLDVTHNKQETNSATAIARKIKQAILEETGLTASAGVSINKFLAKVASGMNKPDGLTVIPPHESESFVESLPIEKFHGIGQVIAKKMHELGIHHGMDLKERTEDELVQCFGKVGRFYYKIARAKDDRPVNPNRIRKSVGGETSFDPDLDNLERMRQELVSIAQVVYQRLRKQQTRGRTLTLKIKFADYQQITRSCTLLEWIEQENQILGLAQDLFNRVGLNGQKVRLLGITISKLDNAASPLHYEQLVLELGLVTNFVSYSRVSD
ncbi:DNA polymerase IV [Leptolyngbya sp. FACHB-541]|uniref:DNA polymerase IV n=1 Tax=Leptolyngbya sp. FACHB-541 TaxID=2692810 RepID=UPI001682399B|nr:DNA polymerase IV [Leptolyngbya sp. FACHB-541]MBD1995942.1 DNA polymerase IV [Leptolyngbya sp. FACHB-541]